MVRCHAVTIVDSGEAGWENCHLGDVGGAMRLIILGILAAILLGLGVPARAGNVDSVAVVIGNKSYLIGVLGYRQLEQRIGAQGIAVVERRRHLLAQNPNRAL